MGTQEKSFLGGGWTKTFKKIVRGENKQYLKTPPSFGTWWTHSNPEKPFKEHCLTTSPLSIGTINLDIALIAYPKCSRYGEVLPIFTINFEPHVSKYAIHGAWVCLFRKLYFMETKKYMHNCRSVFCGVVSTGASNGSDMPSKPWSRPMIASKAFTTRVKTRSWKVCSRVHQ